MDTKQDLSDYAIEKKYGPAECDCEGTCELSFTLGGEIHHYRNIWEKIEDAHYTECPVCIAARRKIKSTLCFCEQIEKANKSSDECLRCHNLAEDCKCGSKAQLV